MKKFHYFLIALFVLLAGCSSMRRPVPVFAYDPSIKFSPQRVERLLDLLESSESFHILLRDVKVPGVMAEQEGDGWLEVELGSSTEDFFHRWSTLRINEKTGAIMRQEVDKDYEYIWVNDKKL